MDNAITESATASLSWIDIFSGVLLSPRRTFQTLAKQAEDSALLGAALLICFVFALDGLRMTAAADPQWALLNIPTSITCGVIMWLCLSGLLAILALCFRAPGRQLKAVFITCGWAFSPWIFMGPIWCYHAALGGAFIVFSVVPLLWVMVMQILAIAATFELKSWQTLALVFVAPALLETLSLLQFFQAVYVTVSALIS